MSIILMNLFLRFFNNIKILVKNNITFEFSKRHLLLNLISKNFSDQLFFIEFF
jgi:hypothetical protein